MSLDMTKSIKQVWKAETHISRVPTSSRNHGKSGIKFHAWKNNGIRKKTEKSWNFVK